MASHWEGEPFLSLRNITLRLYDRTLFEHTDWEVLSDQHWAVVGPNGAGKSTLMRAICGHVPVVGGTIEYHFAEPLQSDESAGPPQAQVGYVTFEIVRGMLGLETAFHQARWNSSVSSQALPVRDYLSEAHVLRRNPYERTANPPDPSIFLKQQHKVVHILEIENLLDRKLVQLSNGEMRKTRIAHALMRQPQLLILDNPFAGLDSAYRERLSGIIDRLMQEDLRIMVVTTRADEIPDGITHVLAVDKHQVVAQGQKDEILHGPAVRAFFTPEPTPEFRTDVPVDAPTASANGALLVDMEDLHVVYGGKAVLQGIDWKVRYGEHWALMGPNGSGKTTLLSLILRDNPQAYANRIRLFGQDRSSAASIWETKRHIGWVSPELHLYYPKQVRCLDVVCSGFLDSVGLHHRATAEQRTIAKEWLETLGLQVHAQHPLRELSQGQQRLVLIARALVKSPQLLVLDEPCHGLDAANRQRVQQVIEFVGAHLETSLIYVTHRPEELPRVMTHVLMLDQGRVARQGAWSSAANQRRKP